MSIDFNEIDIEKMGNDEIVALVNELMHDAEAGLSEWRTRGYKSTDFYRGRQWDTADLDILNIAKVPALTFNIIKPQVNFLSGTQKKIRKDIKIVPVKGTTHTEAKIMTSLIKHTMDKSQGEYLISEQFNTGARTGKGWIKVEIDKSKDVVNGDLVIRNISPFNIFEDPNATEYDVNKTSKYIIEVDWQDKDMIIKKYPEMSESLKGLKSSKNATSELFDNIINYHYGSDSPDSETEDDQLRTINRNKYRYKLIECWIKTYKKRKHWVDKINLTDKVVETKEDIETAEKATEGNKKRFSLIDSVDAILWKLVIVNNIMLEKVEEPFKDTEEGDFELQPSCNIFPYFRYVFDFTDGRCEGIIDSLIDPQQEKNKLRSQTLHILNTTANSGYIYEDGSLSKDMEDQLEDQGARSGINIKYNKNTNPPIKMQPNQLSQAHLFLAEQSNIDIEMISGINKSSKGISETQESGKLNQLRQVQGLTINNTAFDNLDYTFRLLGIFLTEIIRSTNVYSKSEIEAILDDVDIIDVKAMQKASNKVAKTFELPDINMIISRTDPALVRDSLIAYGKLKQEFDERVKEEAKKFVMKRIKNIFKGRYGVKVSQSNFSEAIKNKRIDEILLLEQMRPGVLPMEVIVEALDVQQKEEIIALIKSQQQQMMQMAQMNANFAPPPELGEVKQNNRPIKREVSTRPNQQPSPLPI